ncbi:MAG TPA: PAS domain-containing protein [Casimicrobiaceae bacterium]|jgi:diguanylate cyclase (GGDEF)-like protein/PAS domain S-box-containing protein|nr:PAS domain-containing protein [Casimicrobiaceae bacterium]
MALTRSINRLELATIQQSLVDASDRDGLAALSQRKLNALGIPVAYVDRNQRYRFANKAFTDWLGKRSDEVVGREVIEVVGRDVYALYHAYVEAALGGERTGFERQLATTGRPAIWIRVDYYPDRNAQGQVRGYLVTYSDVDHLRRLEIEAGQREHRLRLVTDSVGLPILYFDRHQKLRFANKPFADWIGAQADDLVGHALRDVLPSDALTEMHAYIERAFAGATVSYERHERKASGELRWVRVTLFPDREVGGRVGGAFAVFHDIDDDMRIRDAMRDQQQQLRLFADNIPGPIAYLDKSLHYTFVNQAFANWVCKPQDEIYGKTPFEVMATDVASFLRPVLKRAQAGEHVEYERIGQNANGQRRWMHGRIAPDLDAAGKVRGLYCTEYDIHDLKLTEQALAAREEQLRLFTDNIPEPVVYLDSDRRYVFVNEAFLRLYGLTREQVIGKRPDEVLGIEASQALAPGRERVITEGEAVTYERAVLDANGRTRWIRARCVPDLNFDGTVKGEYVVGHDITDLKIAQDALAARESQLRAIMDGVPAPVAYIDREEHCHYVNRTFLQYFGLTAAQVAELRLRDVVGHGIYQSAQAMLSRALEGESTAFDRLVPGANGVRRWMTIRVVPDAGPSGEVHGAFVLMNDIHGLKQAQEALRASEAELRLIMDNVPARVSYIDQDYRYRFLNRHNEEWLGVNRKELAGRKVHEVAGEARFLQLQPLLDRVLDGESVSTELLLPQPSGEMKWESIHYAPNRDSEGNVIGIYAVHTDVHDQKRNEDALRRANWMLSSHISNTPLAVLEWDPDLKLIRWSPQAQNIFGWSADEILGMALTDNPMIHGDDVEAILGLVTKLMTGLEPRATSLTRNYRKNGDVIWCEWYHSGLLGDDGQVVSILSFVQDVSSRIQAEERLQYMATRDALTGLPNRLLLHERLTQAIAQARRNGRRVGVLFIDLDRFKNVNDTLGHRIGDELLKHVTQALSAALRETDLLARLGGDEFMVIVEDFDDPQVLGRIAQKLLDAIAQPFTIEEHDIYVTSSIGIAVYPDDSDDPDELLKHADVAMYRSKDLGRNTYQFLDANLAEHRLKQHTLETALRGALKDGILRLHYQPVVRITDRAIVGAEALLRWTDPEHGVVPPTVFIPLAEESGLIHALGEWVLRTAATQCVAWRKAGMPLTISVNLSAKQFYREDLAQRVSEIVRGVGCDPAWMELEVTETSLVHDLDAIRKVLHQLRGEGFTVAIDDFGTGYSSLTHLKHFPIDTLKIDISFIADLETDPGDAAITEAIIGLARGLGLKVVAEGVGTREQLEFLDVRGCHCFQGYWASKPLPAEAFIDFVTRKAH